MIVAKHSVHIKRNVLILLIAVLLAAACVAIAIRNSIQSFEAIYLGIENYGTVGRADVLDPRKAVYRFLVEGNEKLFRIECGDIYSKEVSKAERKTDTDYFGVLAAEDGAYPIQNMLHEGENYRLTAKGKRILSCEALTRHGTIKPLIEGTPGEHTLKNFLQTALMPVGSVLYVYGGGWDWQDIGASVEARSIGVSELWSQAYEQADASYSYMDEEHPSESTFPFGAWNQYYYVGLDCSAYVGWTLYNTLYDESLAHPGLVRSAKYTAKMLMDDYGLGTWDHSETVLHPGDVVSMDGHVWICIGCCADGSAVILESSIRESSTGCIGGGVCLSALSMEGYGDTSCDAYQLASEYMETYYPEWAARYPTCVFDYYDYTEFPDDCPPTGVFRWNVSENARDSAGLADPDGLSELDAEGILEELFRDAPLNK